MKTGLVAGIFVISATVLFTAGLYMIGSSHDMFSHHIDFYTELYNVNGLTTGMKVRVAGFSAGQVLKIEVPDRPSERFRLKLHMDDKLHTLIRDDSIVTVETDGLVGDKFLLIHDGTDQSREAVAGATLLSKEPVELSAIIAKAAGVIDQARQVVGDVQVRLDTALDSVTRTVNHTDGLISDARHGNGAVSVLLNDGKTADRLKETVANADQASANLKQATVQAGQVMTDLQSRNLPAKINDTVENARRASLELNQAVAEVHTTLNDALGPDHFGQTGAQNIRDSLSNANLATANLAEDTEAIKHEFFFRGFFKKRGFYSLNDLTVEQYRNSRYFQSSNNVRSWFASAEIFTKDAKGSEVLSTGGMQLVDQLIDNRAGSFLNRPMLVEGYSSTGQFLVARSRSLLVKIYLQKRLHLGGTDIAAVPLGSIPPRSSGKTSWDGVCLIFLAKGK